MGTIIFDLDGTLADTSGDLIAAANSCFQALGHGDVLRPGLDASTAVRGARAMLQLGFDRLGLDVTEAELEAQYPRLLKSYMCDIDRHTELYPQAREVVARLRAAGHRLGVCTNKPEALAEQLLTRLDFRDVFDSLIGADSLPVKKPDPTAYIEAVRRAGGVLETSLMVGDTRTDHDTARAAGVPSVLVTFASNAMADLAPLAPDALVEHFGQLEEIVDRLFSG